ncbi:hypothetical protein CMI43_01525 [Candidatus Pacearchaeota archaeon]|jgi:uncharacterized membrane protein|nr:hypothetical protein [Candidatus Pacearchaeota archaeon]|tara:strand:+ start:1440 stop:1763 length:324 start_codon:yes stop_codon:yes gene_type:complete
MAKKTKRIGDDDRKLYAFISSFFTIVGFIIALILWRKDKYIMHYAKHGLVLFIAQAVIIVLGPFLYFLSSVLWVLWVILWIVSWMNSFSGKMKKTFLIGDLADKIIL